MADNAAAAGWPISLAEQRLGARASWSCDLQYGTGLLLRTASPLLLLWGPDCRQVFNVAYATHLTNVERAAGAALPNPTCWAIQGLLRRHAAGCPLPSGLDGFPAGLTDDGCLLPLGRSAACLVVFGGALPSGARPEATVPTDGPTESIDFCHALRTPLGTISNAVHLLREGDPLTPHQRWATDVIGRQAEVMTDLLRPKPH